MQSYIVYFGAHSHGSEPTSANQERATDSHHEFLGSFMGCKEKAKQSIFYSYNKHINGFAARLEEKEAEEIAKHPKVISIFENKIIEFQTTRSWDFLGLEKGSDIPLNSLWKKARFGDGIIIANMDTGIWPESKSFGDEGMGPVPSKWRGICQSGVMDEGKSDGIKCNRKLIGIRYFNKGAEEAARDLNMTIPSRFSFLTARDFHGHGTHTLSTAGGNFVANVSIMGNGYGTAKGGSPKARVAHYKSCWPPAFPGCADADILAAIDAAIYDGVDVISVSIGGKEDAKHFESGLQVGAFHAMKHGIPVVAGAGNSGPAPSTIQNSAPWLITAGASTIDRDFVNYVTLGNGKILKGASLSYKGFPPDEKLYPLIMPEDAMVPNASVAVAEDDRNSCNAKNIQMDLNKLKGKILVCINKKQKATSNDISSLQPAAGANKDVSEPGFGIITINDKESGNFLRANADRIAMSSMNFTTGESIFAYMKSTKNPVAKISSAKTEFNTEAAPMVPPFSSRGPSIVEPNIIKPDITAPGVNIIAANIGDPQFPYKTSTGTSMSTPHVAATTKDKSRHSILDTNKKEMTPFDYGSGYVRPDLAADPGLVYDLSADDYLNFLCARGTDEKIISMFYPEKTFVCPKSSNLADFNYPSIAVAQLNDSVTITRRLKNVGKPETYNVSVEEPTGVSVQVEPKSLTFGKQWEEKTFKAVFKRDSNDKLDRYVFGALTWSDGYHHVRSPIAVKL
ncbi:hypothetical protein QYF36_024155 [Acer negundo]|nr:hypothetical protein QYF36_024155 [Acer negundo]